MNSKHRLIFVALTAVLTVMSLLFFFKYMAEKKEKEETYHDYSYLLQSLIEVNDLNADEKYKDYNTETMIFSRETYDKVPVDISWHWKFNREFYIIFDLTNKKKVFGVLPLDDTNRLIQAVRQEFVGEMSYLLLYNEETGCHHTPLFISYEELKKRGMDLWDVKLGDDVLKTFYQINGDIKWKVVMKGKLTLDLKSMIEEIKNNNGMMPEDPRYLHTQSLVDDFFNDSISIKTRKFGGHYQTGYENYYDSLISYRHIVSRYKLYELLGRNLEEFRVNFVSPNWPGSYKFVFLSNTDKINGIVDGFFLWNKDKILIRNAFVEMRTVESVLDNIKRQLKDFNLPDYHVLAKYNKENYNEFEKKIKSIKEYLSKPQFFENLSPEDRTLDNYLKEIDLYAFLAKRYYLHNSNLYFSIPENAKEYNLLVWAATYR